MSRKIVTFHAVFLLVFFVCFTRRTDATFSTTKDITRVITSTLGLGPRCNGCPARYCDDDPAIIQGYCCGCRRLNDNLPVQCSPYMRCPMNPYELCQQYEYMLYCCC